MYGESRIPSTNVEKDIYYYHPFIIGKTSPYKIINNNNVKN